MLHTEKGRTADGWIDPQTGLEYASQTSAGEGKDPVPHWRNARIKQYQSLHPGKEDSLREYAIYLTGRFDRHGNPYVAHPQKRDVIYAFTSGYACDPALDEAIRGRGCSDPALEAAAHCP